MGRFSVPMLVVCMVFYCSYVSARLSALERARRRRAKQRGEVEVTPEPETQVQTPPPQEVQKELPPPEELRYLVCAL